MVSLSVSVPVIDCFYEMERSSVQAVAIVDDGTDVLVKNLPSDIAAAPRRVRRVGFRWASPRAHARDHADRPPAEDRAYSPATAYGVALAREARGSVSARTPPRERVPS